MKKYLISGIIALMMSSAALNAQPWLIGSPNAASVTATLSGGTLTISGTGKMQDFDWQGTPWYSVKTTITSLSIGQGITSIGSYAFDECSNIAGDVSIPNGVTSIGANAFDWCNHLTSVSIPSSVTSIGNLAFDQCSRLTSVIIPYLVRSLGDKAFAYCSGLTSITSVNPNPSNITLGVDVFYGINKTTCVLNVPVGSLLLYQSADQWKDFTHIEELQSSWLIGSPNAASVTATLAGGMLTVSGTGKMKDFGYAGTPWYGVKTTVTSLSIGQGITSIGSYAFDECSNIAGDVSIPNGVTSIGANAFDWCNHITSVSIPSSITSIGNLAFDQCSRLTSVIIPSSVASLGDKAFAYCSGLTSITSVNPNPSNITLGADVFYWIDKTACVLYVPASSVSLYQTAAQWGDFNNNIKEIPPACSIGSTNYTTLDDALAAVPAGVSAKTTIKLLANISYPNQCTIYNKKITFDLSGKNLTFNMLRVDGGAVVDYTGSGSFSVVSNITNTNVGSGYYGLLVLSKSSCTLTHVEGDIAPAGTLDVITCKSGSSVIVNGDVVGSSHPWNGAILATDASTTVTVNGNVTSPVVGTGVYSDVAAVTINGNISAPNGTGAYVIAGGTITVNGTITAQTYISISSVTKTAADFTTPTTKPGYLTYTNGSSTVWVRSQTYANLYSAEQGEMNAVAHYKAFADKATAEGYPTVACLFRATADAELKHADDEWAVLTSMGATDRPVADTPVVGTTAENLQAAFDGETYEWTTMYPGFLATAQTEGETDAAHIFNLARQAEQVHAGNYSDALSHLDNATYLNSKYAVVYRCPVCGEVVTELPSSRCPICGTDAATFVKYDSATGIINADIQNLNIFPNPVKDELCVTAESQINKVEIYNMDGKMLMQENNFAGKMNVSSLAKGLYFVKIYINGEAAIRKMIKN